jgi:hypothetical protein
LLLLLLLLVVLLLLLILVLLLLLSSSSLWLRSAPPLSRVRRGARLPACLQGPEELYREG